MGEDATTPIRRMSSYVQDGLLAVSLTVMGWLSLYAGPSFKPSPGGDAPASFQPLIERHPLPSWQAFVLVAAAFVPLTLRRRFPIAVLAVTSVAAGAYQATHNPPSMMFVAPLIALYTVGTLRQRQVLFIAGILSAGVAMAVSLPGYSDSGFWAEAVRIISVYAVAGALGDATRNRRAYVVEVEERAAEAERTREEEASRRVDEERLRIARELHDVTAHSLSIIAVQSGAAAAVLDSDPEAARKALEAIRGASKDALDELRAMLGVLRAPGEPDAPLAPMPGLTRITDLVAPLLEAGFEVHVNVPGRSDDAPSVVEFSAYRIVQEALTNVVRHAGKCRVELVVERTAEALVVRVEDDGRTPSGADFAQGHGLAGMAERAAALGGSFEAGPRAGGGFAVVARLPLGARSSE